MVVDGRKQMLTDKPSDEGEGTSTNQEHTIHDQSQTNVLAVAIVALTDEYRTRDKENQRQQEKTNRWVKAGTIFVAFYTVITFFQSYITWKTLVETIHNDRIEQRA